MSNVLSFAEARATSFAHDFIQEAYQKLARTPGFTIRKGQPDLSRNLMSALIDDVPMAAEAPTGTGKTIAYLVAGLGASKHLETVLTGESLPIVVATATVGLQTQVVTGDLPKFFEAKLLEPQQTVIAKGRNRYYCVLAAERLLSGNADDHQYDMFDADANVEVDGLDEIREMDEAWHGGSWKGDIDSFPGKRPIFWAKVQASSDTCIGHRCDFFQECPYFAERRRVSKARVVIANHDLVMADLVSQMADQETVFPFNRYILIFDEAHHVPSKAMEAGAAEVDILETLHKLSGMTNVSKKFLANGELARFFDAKDIGHESFSIVPLKESLEKAHTALTQVKVDPMSGNKRFRKGVVPDNLKSVFNGVYLEVERLRETLGKATSALKNSSMATKDPKQKPFIAEALYEGSMMMGVLAKLWKAVKQFTSDHEAVRWVSVKDTYASIHASPIEGNAILKDLLWDNPRVRPVMVSATLQDVEGFERYKERTGLPKDARTYAMPHIFPYRENTIYLENMRYSPRFDERESYLKELKEKLLRVIDPNEGTLIIFNSREVMKAIVPALQKKFPQRVMAQGEKGIKQLVAEHRRVIDNGEGNILAGLATVSEGLDLPGKYCTHVIITAIPFAVPTNPVEEERAELLGKEYFAKHALPDAFVKLVQMVGRLMRRETDRGIITVFDKRLYETNYGRKLLRALPDFRKKHSMRATIS